MDLQTVKEELHALLDECPREAPLLRLTLEAGRLHGVNVAPNDPFETDCCCIYGTVATAQGLDGWEVIRAARDDRPHATPLEDFIHAVRPGDTPANNAVVRQLVEWIDEWQGIHGGAK
jgi:hypothetical protein